MPWGPQEESQQEWQSSPFHPGPLTRGGGPELYKAIGQEKRRDGKIDDFLRWKSWFDDELKHPLKIEPANAKYVSPSIQNA